MHCRVDGGGVRRAIRLDDKLGQLAAVDHKQRRELRHVIATEGGSRRRGGPFAAARVIMHVMVRSRMRARAVVAGPGRDRR